MLQIHFAPPNALQNLRLLGAPANISRVTLAPSNFRVTASLAPNEVRQQLHPWGVFVVLVTAVSAVGAAGDIGTNVGRNIVQTASLGHLVGESVPVVGNVQVVELVPETRDATLEIGSACAYLDLFRLGGWYVRDVPHLQAVLRFAQLVQGTRQSIRQILANLWEVTQRRSAVLELRCQAAALVL